MKIRCLIVDDEPLSQKVLEKFILDVDFLYLSAICSNAVDAMLELKKGKKIDLLFLDINMPKISGLEFYKSLQNPPEVIFTTAYTQYAVDGFEVNAVDYLLKPFSFNRFLTAVNKFLEKRNSNEKKSNDNFLIIKSNKILYKILMNDVLFIEAYGDYVKVHLKDKYLLTYNTFANFFGSLQKDRFIQTHKSFAVNMDRIDTVNGNRITIGKHLIPIGQKFKSKFLKWLNKN